MNRCKAVGLICCVALMALATPRSAQADEWNQKTKVTFSKPIEVPGVGAQVLPAGSYVFKLLDSLSDRHIVRIFNEDETHVYTTILAIPNYRMRASDETVITFRERVAGEPRAIRAWFYPGREWGHEFVYKKSRATELAKFENENVLATSAEPTAETSVNDFQTAPVVTVNPAGEEAPMVQEAQPAATQPAAEPLAKEEPAATNGTPPPAPVRETAEPQAEELPQTASPMPFLGLLGLLSLGTGLVFRSVAKRTV